MNELHHLLVKALMLLLSDLFFSFISVASFCVALVKEKQSSEQFSIHQFPLDSFILTNTN